MKVGMKGDPHDVVYPDYSFWGKVGKVSIEKSPVDAADIDHACSLLQEAQVSLEAYHLTHADHVSYYQGAQIPEAKGILLRFERLDGRNTSYGGEHMSVVYDIENKRLLGLTRMQAGLDNQSFVSHQQALTIALNLLKKVAPDLISTSTAIPELIDLPNGERMDFVPAVSVDQLELHWIGDHGETIRADGSPHEVHGMKVKMQIKGADELYAWVVIDKNGQVETFERSVNWDFDAMKRKTQMWLHDPWLVAQNITLQPATHQPRLAQQQEAARYAV